jgi:hypothetical protein
MGLPGPLAGAPPIMMMQTSSPELLFDWEAPSRPKHNNVCLSLRPTPVYVIRHMEFDPATP